MRALLIGAPFVLRRLFALFSRFFAFPVLFITARAFVRFCAVFGLSTDKTDKHRADLPRTRAKHTRARLWWRGFPRGFPCGAFNCAKIERKPPRRVFPRLRENRAFLGRFTAFLFLRCFLARPTNRNANGTRKRPNPARPCATRVCVCVRVCAGACVYACVYVYHRGVCRRNM